MMQLPDTGKLYSSKGEELKTLYDSAENVIWQGGPPVLWQGSWVAGSSPLLAVTANWSKYAYVKLQFDSTISQASGNMGSTVLPVDGEGVLITKENVDTRLSFTVWAINGATGTISLSGTNGVSMQGFSGKGALTLTAIYGIEY